MMVPGRLLPVEYLAVFDLVAIVHAVHRHRNRVHLLMPGRGLSRRRGQTHGRHRGDGGGRGIGWGGSGGTGNVTGVIVRRKGH
jgi:hypothetical protein